MASQQCSQGDGRAAVMKINGQPLCVDCYTKLQAAQTDKQNADLQMLRHQMAMMNHAAAEMDNAVGLPGLSTPRVQIPAMRATGPVTITNFKLDNSTVGTINTGNVATIDTTVTQLQDIGNKDAAKAIHDVTQAILNESRLSPNQKDELLEQIAFLSEQVTNVKDRKPSMIKAALDGITKTAAAVTTVATAWQAAAPILKAIFRIH